MSPKTVIKASATAPAPTIDLDPYRIEFGRVFAPLWLASHYKDGAWQPARLETMENIQLHPAAVVLHYGQAVFEGMKAHRWDDGSINLFRPIENARRLNRSAARMGIPTLDENQFVEGLRSLIDAQRDWVPKSPGCLYIRPTIVATEPCLLVRGANEFLYFTIVLPTGSYFPQTSGVQGAGSVKVYVGTGIARAAKGGTGNVKAAANYAGTLKIIADAKDKGCSQVMFLDAERHKNVEEMGGMNVFFISGRKLMTPRLTDTILPGIIRDSVTRLAPTLGFEVEETDIDFKGLCEQIKKGTVTEGFACGTAAVIVGIESFLLDSGESLKFSAAPGPVTSTLYENLTGIQYGRKPDPFDWIVKV